MQERLAALEGAEACVATASGMSAILSTSMALLKAGDHVLCSAGVFGATVQLFSTILSRFGIETTFVPPNKVEEWQRAVRPTTKLFFLETPSNPLGEVSDIAAALAAVAKKAGAVLAVDNAFCTPALQKPLEFGADLVIHSATKYSRRSRAGCSAARCWAPKRWWTWSTVSCALRARRSPPSTPG